MFQYLYISPAMQVSILPVVIIPQAELWANKLFIQNPTSGNKILLTKFLPQGHKFKGDFVAFKGNFVASDKICDQMLNNFTAFSTAFYNFHIVLFSLINDLFSFILL